VLLRSCWWYRETSLSPSVDNIGHLSCFDTKTEGRTRVHYDCEASIIFQINPNQPLKNITVLPNKDFELGWKKPRSETELAKQMNFLSARQFTVTKSGRPKIESYIMTRGL
ncbi:hypothetical protein PO909_025278, partial [Leuciscus waleckii]